MDSENVWVDVCGEGDEEDKENKENVMFKSPRKPASQSPDVPQKRTFGAPLKQELVEIRSQFGPGSCQFAADKPTIIVAQQQPSCSFDPEGKGRENCKKREENEDEGEEGTEDEEDDDEEEGDEEEGKKHPEEGGGGAGGGNKAPRRSGGAPRKEKSLGKLCNRFLIRMGEESRDGRDIHLESVARKMSVEKRRIYDIVNVMEALEAMSKTNKSFYRWHGLGQLPKLIDALQSEAQQSKLPQRVDEVAKKMCTFVELSPHSFYEGEKDQKQPRKSTPKMDDPNNSMMNCSNSSSSSAFEDGIANRDRCGKNSLAQLCRRFLMVLLCKESRKVSLDVASTVLIKNPDKDGFEPPPRSKCRRLYDIANVLVAMRLILKKHALFGTKKIPLFEYCGPEPDANPASGHARMLEFLERSGLTGIAAEPMEEKYDQMNGSETKSKDEESKKDEEMEKKSLIMEEIGTRKRKRSETGEVAREETEQRQTKCAKREEKGEEEVEEQLPRPKPMMPSSAHPPIGFCAAIPPGTPLVPLPHHPASAQFFFPPTRPQYPQPIMHFWSSQQMALISSLIPSSSLHHPQHHPIPSFFHHHPLHSSSSPFSASSIPSSSSPSFSSSTPPIKCQKSSVSPPKVRHSVQSILGVSQRANISANNAPHPQQKTSPAPNLSKAFKPVVLQQRQNLHHF